MPSASGHKVFVSHLDMHNKDAAYSVLIVTVKKSFSAQCACMRSCLDTV